ncbi:MAG TPA: hypothetical protein VME01_02225, partial [Solirubrobacteraceae bacterium]|nr:hypothetical protein [Solirubrobacteraceae bacterium]
KGAMLDLPPLVQTVAGHIMDLPFARAKRTPQDTPGGPPEAIPSAFDQVANGAVPQPPARPDHGLGHPSPAT